MVEEAAAKKVKGVIVITRRVQGGRGQGARAGEPDEGDRQGARDPADRPELPGRDQHRSERVSMNAAFGRKMPEPGNLAFISQSGALCTSVLDYAEERHMGFSKFISFGNKADVNEIDLLRYLQGRPKTTVIAMYLEDITNGRRVHRDRPRDLLGNAQADACLKSGRSPEGAKAAAATPVRWPVPTRSTTPSSARAACSGSTRSPSCSTTRRLCTPSRCPGQTAWPSSPTPAGRASWPPTPRCATA